MVTLSCLADLAEERLPLLCQSVDSSFAIKIPLDEALSLKGVQRGVHRTRTNKHVKLVMEILD